jgi:TonB family protein
MNQLIQYFLCACILLAALPAVAGADDKTQDPKDKSTASRKDSNIVPYRKDMLMRLASGISGKGLDKPLTVGITVSRDGKLLKAHIEESSGSKEQDQQVLDAIKKVKLAPLPDWYKEKSMNFKIDFAKVTPPSGAK